MKCEILKLTLDNVEAVKDAINTRLLPQVDKFISVNQSSIGQGSSLLTIIYEPKIETNDNGDKTQD